MNLVLKPPRPALRALGPMALVAAFVVAALSWAIEPAFAAPTPLVGTFTIVSGSCSGASASGTYLRMVLSGGTNGAGPFFSNSNSTCADKTYTLLAPGSQSGLVTGSYQPEPSPAFDANGNSLSNSIMAPVEFEGVKFSTATNSVDPQTGLHVPTPSITATGSSLTGNLESFGVTWNDQQFNQGSPKPDGTSPANTTPVSGTYNPVTGAYSLQWSSQIVGGPFNGFSAFWSLTGRFIPAASASTPAQSAVTPPPVSAPPSHVASSTPAGAAAPPSAVGTPTAVASSATGSAPGSTPAPSVGTTPTAAPHPVAVAAGPLRSPSIATTGWSAPDWLLALVSFIGLLGLGGLWWSQREIRRRRATELEGASL